MIKLAIYSYQIYLLRPGTRKNKGVVYYICVADKKKINDYFPVFDSKNKHKKPPKIVLQKQDIIYKQKIQLIIRYFTMI